MNNQELFQNIDSQYKALISDVTLYFSGNAAIATEARKAIAKQSYQGLISALEALGKQLG